MSSCAPPRRFQLIRRVDHTGVSGTGIVAYGVQWADGSLTLRWNGVYSSIVNWRELDHMLAVHGHDGATAVEWVDNPEIPVDISDAFDEIQRWETNGGAHSPE